MASHVLGSAFVPASQATSNNDSSTTLSSPSVGSSSLGMLIVAELSAQVANHLAPITEEVRANRRALDKLQDSILHLSTQIEASRPASFESLPVLQHWDAALDKLGLHLKASHANQQLSKANLDRLEEIDNLLSKGSVHEIGNDGASSPQDAPASKADVAEVEPPPLPPPPPPPPPTVSFRSTGTGDQQRRMNSRDIQSPRNSTLGHGGFKPPQIERTRTLTKANRNNMMAVMADHLKHRETGTFQDAPPILKFSLRTVRGFMDWFINLEEPPRRTVLAKVVDSRGFALFFGLVISANVLVLSADANHQMQHPGDQKLARLDWIFLFFYGAEIAMKFAVHRWYLFVAPDPAWHMFDTCLVAVSLYSNLVSLYITDRSASAAAMQTLRIFKIAILFRAVRLIRIFDIMQRILALMAHTLFIFMGGFLMMFLVLLVFGLLCVQLLSTRIHDLGDEDLLEEIRSIFGSVQLGMFTLFRAAFHGEDWNKYVEVVAQISPLTAAIFIFFLALVQISFFNILTAVFVVQTTKLGKPDQQTKAMEETLNQRRTTEQIRELCHMMDRDGSQTISRDEFYESLESDFMRSEFMICGLNINNAEDFFELLLAMSRHVLSIAKH